MQIPEVIREVLTKDISGSVESLEGIESIFSQAKRASHEVIDSYIKWLFQYFYSDKEKENILHELKLKYKLKNTESIKVQRYKGLGEMNPEELYDTTMNKETRILKKVTYEDYIENDLIFTKLMGKEVKSRKKFIISHFDEVNVLDI